MITRRTALIVALLSYGYKSHNERSTGRHKAFKKDSVIYYVGARDSLRYGRTLSESYASSPRVVRDMIREGRELLK